MTASNHVSTLTKHFNITVDRLQPMANLTVKGVPDVVPQGSNQTLTTSVLVDMSVPATFRYESLEKGQRITKLIIHSFSDIYLVIFCLSFTVYEVIKLSIFSFCLFFLSFLSFELPVCHNSTTAVETEL